MMPTHLVFHHILIVFLDTTVRSGPRCPLDPFLASRRFLFSPPSSSSSLSSFSSSRLLLNSLVLPAPRSPIGPLLRRGRCRLRPPAAPICAAPVIKPASQATLPLALHVLLREWVLVLRGRTALIREG